MHHPAVHYTEVEHCTFILLSHGNQGLPIQREDTCTKAHNGTLFLLHSRQLLSISMYRHKAIAILESINCVISHTSCVLISDIPG